MRLGLGPVFAYEWLTTTRRWQVYAGGPLFVGALLAGLVVVWWGKIAGRTLRRPSAGGGRAGDLRGGRRDAAGAGAARGAGGHGRGDLPGQGPAGRWTHLLVTDLSDAEIVLGKLAARLVPGPGAGRAARCRHGPVHAARWHRPGGAERGVPGDRGRGVRAARWP
jgi:hypothetical protein